MMRILLLSDLHLEHAAGYVVPEAVDYDVVLLAGDIHSPGHLAVRWAASESTFGGRPVIYVPGNHEFYGQEIGAELNAMREAAQGTPVHVLSRDSVVLHGVRFLGATLWTDFALPVGNESEPSDSHEETDVARALAAANRYVMDFRCIKLADPSIPRHRGEDVKRRLLTAEDTLAMHHIDRDWLRRELQAGHSGPTVVVTHHAPHRRSVSKKYRSDWVTPAFVSDLPESLFADEPMSVGGRRLYTGGPVLWAHGHTHTAFDYQVHACRVVSNPRGYRMRDGAWESAQFDSGLVVEVSESARRENVFEGDLEQVVHALLEHWRLSGGDARVSCADLAEMAGASPSTVSIALQELEAWVDVTDCGPTRSCKVGRPACLLDAWAQAWKERLPNEKRTRWYAYASGPGGIVDHMLERLSGRAGWAMTGAGAANALVPHLTSVDRVSIIVPLGASEEWAADMELEPVDKGANVTFIERTGASLMFGDTHRDKPGYRMASRWVMYLDLLDGVGRNKELAAELRLRALRLGHQP